MVMLPTVSPHEPFVHLLPLENAGVVTAHALISSYGYATDQEPIRAI